MSSSSYKAEWGEENPRPDPGWKGSWVYEWPEETCAGCGKPIVPPAYAMIDKNGEPYHMGCQPKSIGEKISEKIENFRTHRFRF